MHFDKSSRSKSCIHTEFTRLSWVTAPNPTLTLKNPRWNSIQELKKVLLSGGLLVYQFDTNHSIPGAFYDEGTCLELMSTCCIQARRSISRIPIDNSASIDENRAQYTYSTPIVFEDLLLDPCSSIWAISKPDSYNCVLFENLVHFFRINLIELFKSRPILPRLR